jgi:hypothetical protein
VTRKAGVARDRRRYSSGVMTRAIHRPTSIWLGAAALGLALTACGLGNASNTTPGQAFTEASIAGTIILYDASLPLQARTAPMHSDGSFAIQTTGLTSPYLLRAQWSEQGSIRQLYGISEGDDNLDINGFTDMAYGAACLGKSEDRFFTDSDGEGKRGAADRARALLTTMPQGLLAPLFQRYGIADLRADRTAGRRLLEDVIVIRRGADVSFTNRATGRVFFVGQIGNLELGTFTDANMPPGPTAPTCTAFTYTDFAACQPDNTQVRAVLTSSPTGCSGGSPVTTQACTYVPPVVTCTAFTYSPYGACLPDNTQVRTVLTSSPTGCSGGSPVTTQACTYAPPCTLATAVPSCTTCHGTFGSGKHKGRPLTCAICHGPVDNGTGRPSIGMSAALSQAECRLTYPTSGTHNNGVTNFGTAY